MKKYLSLVLTEKQKETVNRYKIYAFPALILIISFFIIGQVGVPQFSSILDTNTQISAKKDEIDIIQNSIKKIQSISNQELKDNLSLANSALPSSPDVSSVYSGLSNAVSKAGVVIDTYTITAINSYVKAGVPSTPSVKTDTANNGEKISLTVDLLGDSKSALKFVQALYKIFPLAEVTDIAYREDNKIQAKVDFYYKPYNASIIATGQTVEVPTAFQKNILKQIKDWNQ